MTPPDRGEVWIVDLGMAGKVRPCLILSLPADPQDRALVTLVAHTTGVRGSRFEVPVSAWFLHGSGAVDAQNLLTVPLARLIRRLGLLPPDQFAQVEDAVRRWLGL